MINQFLNFLEKSECDYMVNLIEGLDPINTLDTNRKVDVFSFKDVNTIKFLKEKFLKINIINNPSFSINRYLEGYFFDLHIDMGGIYDPYCERLKTLIINLSDENDYIGGDLIIKDDVMSKEKGTAYLFPSNTQHELKEIISGTRYSLVCWLKKEHLKNNSII